MWDKGGLIGGRKRWDGQTDGFTNCMARSFFQSEALREREGGGGMPLVHHHPPNPFCFFVLAFPSLVNEATAVKKSCQAMAFF